MRARLALTLTLCLAACGGSQSAHSDASTASGSSGGEASQARRGAPERAALFRATRELDATETTFISRLVGLTSSTRTLAVLRPIVTRIATAQEISRHLISTIEDEDIVELVDLYVALGMLAPGTDVVAIMARVVGEQVVGFYDPDLDVLVVRDDVMRALAGNENVDPEALVTIAHEVIHALQGQHLDLAARMEEEHDTDFDDAYQALVEGDATLGMLLVAARVGGVPFDDIFEGVSTELDFAGGATPAQESAELSSAPAIIRIGMTAPYIAGLGFCAAIYRRSGYAGVNAAHARRPASTEQVLHPDKYLANELPRTIDLGPLPAIASAGYQNAREDTLGELEVGIYLGRGVRSGIDTVAGAGWDGDRVRLYRRGATLGAVFMMSFDTVHDAVEAEAAAHNGDQPDDGRVVYRTGRVLAVTHGLEASLAATVAARADELARQFGNGASR